MLLVTSHLPVVPMYMSYRSYTGRRSYNFVNNFDEVTTSPDKIYEVITSSDNSIEVTTFTITFDEVIASTINFVEVI